MDIEVSFMNHGGFLNFFHAWTNIALVLWQMGTEQWDLLE